MIKASIRVLCIIHLTIKIKLKTNTEAFWFASKNNFENQYDILLPLILQEFNSIDMRRYLHGGVNITGFQLLDPDNKRLQDFMDIWESLDKYNYPGAGIGRFNVRNKHYKQLISISPVQIPYQNVWKSCITITSARVTVQDLDLGDPRTHLINISVSLFIDILITMPVLTASYQIEVRFHWFLVTIYCKGRFSLNIVLAFSIPLSGMIHKEDPKLGTYLSVYAWTIYQFIWISEGNDEQLLSSQDTSVTSRAS